MKKYALALSLFCLVSVTGCVTPTETDPTTSTDNTSEATEVTPDQTTNNSPAELDPIPSAGPSVEIGEFSRYELDTVNEGGCGMTLLMPGADYYKDGMVLFNGLENSPIMKLNGELSQLTLITASGEEFYGQQTSQSFETEDGAIAVDVDVTLGEPGEIESFAIPEGTLTVTSAGRSEKTAIVGDAGC